MPSELEPNASTWNRSVSPFAPFLFSSAFSSTAGEIARSRKRHGGDGNPLAIREMKFMRTLRSVGALRCFMPASFSSDLVFKYTPAMRVCDLRRGSVIEAQCSNAWTALARVVRECPSRSFHPQLYQGCRDARPPSDYWLSARSAILLPDPIASSSRARVLLSHQRVMAWRASEYFCDISASAGKDKSSPPPWHPFR